MNCQIYKFDTNSIDTQQSLAYFFSGFGCMLDSRMDGCHFNLIQENRKKCKVWTKLQLLFDRLAQPEITQTNEFKTRVAH